MHRLGDLLQQERKPEKTTATWEGVEVVEIFQRYFPIPDKGAFGKTFYYRKIKELRITIDQAKKIMDIMQARRKWLKQTKGSDLQCGKWLTNRFVEMKQIGVDRFISKNSK